MKLFWAAIAFLFAAVVSGSAAEVSHGPLLGGVTESYAGIWLRTDKPASVRVALEGETNSQMSEGETSEENGLSLIAEFHELQPDTKYDYRVLVDGTLKFQTNFTTPGPRLATRPVRIVYGSCYLPKFAIPGFTNEFATMASRNADAVIFLGDFPYSKEGSLEELRREHQVIRSTFGFRDLTANRPAYAIWDDHDFGPNDSDSTHAFVNEAFRGFKEHWPNPAFGLKGVPGIFSKVRFGDIDIFRLDCRYHSLRSKERSQMLGKEQFEWLCRELKKSKARYKLICSGPQLWRNKGDSWGGAFHRDERDQLLKFIEKEKITGALFISGDVHRSNIHRQRLADGRYIYDFTGSPLAQNTRVSPKEEDWPPQMIYSYPDENQFSELEFYPAGDKETAVIYRVFSLRKGLVAKFVVSPAELGLSKKHSAVSFRR
jgi:alkaline phosphatase D